VIAIVIRAWLIGVMFSVVILLLAQTHLYATAMVIIGIAALTSVEMARAVSRLADDAAAKALDAAGLQSEKRTPLLDAARSLDHAHALLDTVPAALIAVDDARIVFMNRGARAMVREESTRLSDIPALTHLAQHLSAMRPGAREVVNLADGSAAYVSCSEFSTPQTRPVRLLALQRITGDLDAVEARAWGEMARVLAHEIMNSLTPIASLSESLEQLLQGREADAELIGALEVIKRRSQGLMNFVERYRAVAELPAPKATRNEMKPFMDSIDRLMSGTFKERGISFQIQVVPHDLVAHLDRELVEQALINLVQNAVDAVAATPNPRIAATCRQSDNQLEFEVRDNGRGLPDGAPGKLLTPFYSTKPGGGGIGLSVARHVALAHGGQLRMSNHEAGGAEVVLALPSAVAN
jgi:two-component system, NtrC family, nitrogen regulation sensor histidine kinase NtrY